MDGRHGEYLIIPTKLLPLTILVHSVTLSLQVSALSTFYLCLLLTPLLQETSKSHYNSPPSPESLSKPHLSIVTSGLHYMTTFAPRKAPAGGMLLAMNDQKKYGVDERYNESKVMVVWFAKSLAQQVGDSVIVNSVNPGYCPGSGLANDVLKSSVGARIGIAVMSRAFGRSNEQGVRGMAWGALRGKVNGAYVSNCEEEP